MDTCVKGTPNFCSCFSHLKHRTISFKKEEIREPAHSLNVHIFFLNIY